MTLSELITLLEGAGEGSRELDAEIGYAVDLIAEDDLSWRATVDRAGIEEAVKRANSHQNVWSSYLPHYSTSVDAALSLLPDDEQWGVNWDIEGVHGGVCVYVWTGHPTYESTFVRSPLASSFREAVKHLPRLICIAALKAHSTLSEQGKGGGG